MEEIFTNISEGTRQGAKLVFDGALKIGNPLKTLEMLNEYTKSCLTDEERDFIRFYFNLRMEQMLNDSNNVER